MRNEEGGTLKRWIGYEHGINLGGWLSQCPPSVEHYDHFIQKSVNGMVWIMSVFRFLMNY